ncbi:AAA domain-containing protein [Allorhodopirellula solitaria]|uniref:Protein kinase domain-containing protein n=1 Tax=Allorhodopirellula solitaria TaxID=2527987 RepID=A0A5C5WZP9_9BACT|nr:AAA domain-containing protein [Allorhodopirellula solitaria]TWT56118.1 hypothetical protein CA85_45910 [Allorhodopirellula solitaria]
MLKEGAQVLKGNYTVLHPVSQNDRHEVWAAVDQLGIEYVLKTWAFDGKPDAVDRQLWEVEQRNLYRLASSPNAKDQMLVMREADLHWNETGGGGYFVLVLQSPGVNRLDQMLERRGQVPWLRRVDEIDVRVQLWRSIRVLAEGVNRIHELHMLHRRISAKSIFLSEAIGPSSMRLSAFEWTVRIGDPHRAIHLEESILFPPEFYETEARPFSIESDWFMFGALIAHILCGASFSPDDKPEDQYSNFFRCVTEQTFLTDVEKSLIERLLSPTPQTRLSSSHEVFDVLSRIMRELDNPPVGEDQYLGLVVQLGPQQPMTQAIIELDDRIAADEIERQRSFIQNDLSRPTILEHRPNEYIVKGRRLRYFISEYTRPGESPKQEWDLAFSYSPAEVRHSEGDESQNELRDIPISVFTKNAVFNNPETVLKNAVRWKRFFPTGSDGPVAGDNITQFHDFFRATNQIELLMRDAEIFSYEVVERKPPSENGETLVVRENERRQLTNTSYLQKQEMVGFLNRERASNRYGDHVLLSDDDEIRSTANVDLPEFWRIVDLDPSSGEITLRRGIAGPMLPAPDKGFLRCYGMFGSVRLIERRAKAIANLRSHTFLLQALLDPSFLYMHSELTRLPAKLDDSLDSAKQEAIKNIWSTRPIFAVQGPPGTGKTTLVANLLEQIFRDNPVSQVLVSAQAHAAVDVLRNKVSEEVFSDTSDDSRPLAVRIPRSRNDKPFGDSDYPHAVAKRLLESAKTRLAAIHGKLSPVQKDWSNFVDEAVAALMRQDTESEVEDFVELVRRSANITYCTTTSATLAQLAVSKQTFDWSIIEEAGKAHGFDLVLPLQNGHRWLLIGDHKQLPPYRYKDFQESLRHLDEMVSRLDELRQAGEDLVDRDFVRDWSSKSNGEKAKARDLWLSWLPVFERLFQLCKERTGRAHAPGLSSMLTQQHRMHPMISDLVSRAFYNGSIESMTVDSDGNPKESVLHSFELPSEIRGRPIVWLDTGAATDGFPGEDSTTGPYTSPSEVEAIVSLINTLKTSRREKQDLAVLSPYRLQVMKLDAKLKTDVYDSIPEWLTSIGEGDRFASTVDSFQGNQADVVVVSLVRNNEKDNKRSALGFVEDAERLNVMMSRAEKLLVLVGSWKFFERILEDVPADPGQPLGHMRLAFDFIAEQIEMGNAARIHISSLRELS